jgi:hypothetical protein
LEESTDLTPRISVIIPAFMGYDSVGAALESWDAQSARDQLELIVLCPGAPGRVTSPGHVVVVTGNLLLHEARALATRKARGEYVLFAEDHCLPDPDCGEWIIRRLDEGWDAVGPALRPGDPGIVSHGSFLISYAQWMLPNSGSIAYLPGHNAVVRRQLLLDVGDELEDLLIATLFLMSRLRAEGRRFAIDERARMRHFDALQWNHAGKIFLTIGQACGAMRAGHLSRLSRFLYAFLTPVIAVRHFSRGLAQYFRAGKQAGFEAKSIFASAYFAGVWGIGEALGAWRGLDHVKPMLWVSEIKPVSREHAASSR